MKITGKILEWIDRQNIVIQLLALAIVSTPFILTVLSFFGIEKASDLLEVIYDFTTIYKNFNVDLKILTWSSINIAITLYTYRKVKSTEKEKVQKQTE